MGFQSDVQRLLNDVVSGHRDLDGFRGFPGFTRSPSVECYV